MSSTIIGAGDPRAAAVWAKDVSAVPTRNFFVSKWMGKDQTGRLKEEDAGSAICVKTELKESAGDEITVTLRTQLSGLGVGSNQDLEGEEEAQDFRTDTVKINELAHATLHDHKMSQQRVPYSLRVQAKDGLLDWWDTRQEEVFFNHACGNILETRPQLTGHNAVTEPTHLFRRNGAANDGAVNADTTARIRLDDISRLKRIAKKRRIRPMKAEGYKNGDFYGIVLHDDQINDLRTAVASSSAHSWTQIYEAAMQGGEITNNPIFTGAEGMYDGVLIFCSEYVRHGIHNGVAQTNTRRAVFLGAQAMLLAHGKDSDRNNYTWTEEPQDYKRKLGCSLSSIFGMKKATYAPIQADGTPDTSQALDFGLMNLTTYVTPTEGAF